MYQLMRNIHLALGLGAVAMAFIFAASSLTIIYRPWLPQSVVDEERTVRLEASADAAPREIALDLMRNHNLSGDLFPPTEEDGVVKLRIARPGHAANIEYVRATGETKITTKRWGVLETMVQLHVNHGMWHQFIPSAVWAWISLLTSAAMLLLGASGLYLWFLNYQERKIGAVLLAAGLLYGLTALTLTRMQ